MILIMLELKGGLREVRDLLLLVLSSCVVALMSMFSRSVIVCGLRFEGLSLDNLGVIGVLEGRAVTGLSRVLPILHITIVHLALYLCTCSVLVLIRI